jgi:hypothetical protein
MMSYMVPVVKNERKPRSIQQLLRGMCAQLDPIWHSQCGKFSTAKYGLCRFCFIEITQYINGMSQHLYYGKCTGKRDFTLQNLLFLKNMCRNLKILSDVKIKFKNKLKFCFRSSSFCSTHPCDRITKYGIGAFVLVSFPD